MSGAGCPVKLAHIGPRALRRAIEHARETLALARIDYFNDGAWWTDGESRALDLAVQRASNAHRTAPTQATAIRVFVLARWQSGRGAFRPKSKRAQSRATKERIRCS